MSELEFQDEEREALLSIYDGDSSFKQVSPTVFQYKYGENDDIKSLLVEIRWGEKYPTEKPNVNMETFYNKHVKESVKETIKNMLLSEAEQYLGMSMTYSLFEFVKEKFDDLIEDQGLADIEVTDDIDNLTIDQVSCDIKKKAPKKEQLTKAQKRRQWDKVGDRGERPRGWDWVDIVKHLSQTGSKDDQLSSTSSFNNC